MIRARCSEPGCGWTFESESFDASQKACDAHYSSHSNRPDGSIPRYPSRSDDAQVATGALHPPRSGD